jgi:hypothetical protein
MAKAKPTTNEWTERRKRVHRLHLRGVPSWKIAEIEKVSQSAISKDLKAIYVKLADEYPEDLQKARLESISFHKAMKEEALEQWERSKLDAVREITKARDTGGKDGRALAVGTVTEAGRMVEGRVGDASLLMAALACQKAIDEASGLRQNVLVKELQDVQDELRARMKAAGHLLK